MVFCSICTEKKRLESSKPASEPCVNCGESATTMQVRDTYTFCFVPLFWKSHQVIMCNTCEWRT